MSDGKTAPAFKPGDKVQFEDGRHTRVGFVLEHHAADETYPAGCSVLYKMRETNQNRHVRYADTDLSLAGDDEFAFKVGDKVAVTDAAGDVTTAGQVIEVAPTNQNALEPRYGVSFKDSAGQTAVAWWSESNLSLAS